jgi:hypothetical protein
MHLPTFWCDGESSFCIVKFGRELSGPNSKATEYCTIRWKGRGNGFNSRGAVLSGHAMPMRDGAATLFGTGIYCCNAASRTPVSAERIHGNYCLALHGSLYADDRNGWSVRPGGQMQMEIDWWSCYPLLIRPGRSVFFIPPPSLVLVHFPFLSRRKKNMPAGLNSENLSHLAG